VDALKAPIQRIARINSRTEIRNLHSEIIWALRNVSFRVKQGEVIGIIGRNGAGKTTLLKILSKITEPTEGRVELQGRVGSLLEIGTGFHPELTGHENVYLYGAILGMDRWEVRYSSGMYMRLAFAVAAHLEPEILLVDEVLAVGDAVFQTKCLAQMSNITKKGRTVLFVSHNMGAVGSVCHRGIVLDEGQIVFEGLIQEAISYYEEGILQKKYFSEDLDKRTDRSGTGDVRLVSFHIESEKGEKIDRIPNGRTIRLVFGYSSKGKKEAENVDLGILVERESRERVFQLGTRFTGQKFTRLPPRGYIVCTIKKFPLAPGRYNLGAYLQSMSNPSDYITSLAYLEVIDGDFFGSGYQVYENESKILVDGTWSHLDYK
jgi:lipopolysaccharide transport system ATP-binding protein